MKHGGHPVGEVLRAPDAGQGPRTVFVQGVGLLFRMARSSTSARTRTSARARLSPLAPVGARCGRHRRPGAGCRTSSVRRRSCGSRAPSVDDAPFLEREAVLPATRAWNSAQIRSCDHAAASSLGPHWKYIRCRTSLRWLISAKPLSRDRPDPRTLVTTCITSSTWLVVSRLGRNHGYIHAGPSRGHQALHNVGRGPVRGRSAAGVARQVDGFQDLHVNCC